ncbi:hypothetical protein CIHG_00139 [Coccidioides immitis H538.4]|uniref:Uncharacterized protein n=1 Tax=Coccidioides immitis H538.4 TaxID=396776 RepID=A0A0J8RAX8_COCIT|nr:hypothetical protein CIHG_00139 [Coccidioides immitis H538.4]
MTGISGPLPITATRMVTVSELPRSTRALPTPHYSAQVLGRSHSHWRSIHGGGIPWPGEIEPWRASEGANEHAPQTAAACYWRGAQPDEPLHEPPAAHGAFDEDTITYRQPASTAAYGGRKSQGCSWSRSPQEEGDGSSRPASSARGMQPYRDWPCPAMPGHPPETLEHRGLSFEPPQRFPPPPPKFSPPRPLHDSQADYGSWQ